MGVLVQRGVMKRSEARAELGLPATRSDDVYLMPRNLAELYQIIAEVLVYVYRMNSLAGGQSANQSARPGPFSRS